MIFTPIYDCLHLLRSLDSARDDEHRLIARYAAKLAQEQRSGMVSRKSSSLHETYYYYIA